MRFPRLALNLNRLVPFNGLPFAEATVAHELDILANLPHRSRRAWLCLSLWIFVLELPFTASAEPGRNGRGDR